jgi:signal transduction histidine kinase
MWDNWGMRHPFGEWFVSTFIKRRWTVLTPAGTFLAPGVQWLVNHLSVFPEDLHKASVWQAPWWLYVMCFLVCFMAAQIFAWFDQHMRLRELTGMPGLTMELTTDNAFLVTVDSPAYEVTIADVVLPKPDKNMEFARKVFANMFAEGGVQPFYHSNWIIKFKGLPVVKPGDRSVIVPFVAAMSLLPGQVLPYILQAIATSNEQELPITLSYDNTKSPKRTWHAHFVVTYRVTPEKLGLRHVETGEVNPRNNICSCCKVIAKSSKRNNPAD